MPDIIQIAQDLRSELKSERKDWIRERGGERIEMPLDCTVLYGDNDARDVIGALAEETWEYSAQYRNDYTNGWKFLEELQGRWCTRETLALWVEGNLHRFYDNIRIVRRRVSPVEVVND